MLEIDPLVRTCVIVCLSVPPAPSLSSLSPQLLQSLGAKCHYTDNDRKHDSVVVVIPPLFDLTCQGRLIRPKEREGLEQNRTFFLSLPHSSSPGPLHFSLSPPLPSRLTNEVHFFILIDKKFQLFCRARWPERVFPIGSFN